MSASILHVVPRLHHGGPTSSILAEARHAARRGLDSDYAVMALEPGGSSSMVMQAMRQRTRVHVAPPIDRERQLLETADVVVVDWWNTPSMRAFFGRHRGLPLHWVLHCRVNGMTQPQLLVEPMATAPCHLLLTSPAALGLRPAGEATAVVDFVDMPEVVGGGATSPLLLHIGTTNVFKLDPALVDIHLGALRAGAALEVIGSGGGEDAWRDRAAQLGAVGRVSFPGFVDGADRRLREATAFVAPTSRHTYASCDKTLQQSMLAGVPVIAYADSPLAYLVEDGRTGWLAHDREHFGDIAVSVATGAFRLDPHDVAATSRAALDADRTMDNLVAAYAAAVDREPRPLDDGVADDEDWQALQCGTARRVTPSLQELIDDDDALLAFQRWACEGGAAQFRAASSA